MSVLRVIALSRRCRRSGTWHSRRNYVYVRLSVPMFSVWVGEFACCPYGRRENRAASWLFLKFESRGFQRSPRCFGLSASTLAAPWRSNSRTYNDTGCSSHSRPVVFHCANRIIDVLFFKGGRGLACKDQHIICALPRLRDRLTLGDSFRIPDAYKFGEMQKAKER